MTDARATYWLRDEATGKRVGAGIEDVTLAQRRAKSRSSRHSARIAVLSGERVVEVWEKGKAVPT